MSKHLATPILAKPIILDLAPEVKIEVPVGESHFILRQSSGSPESHVVFQLNHPDSRVKVSGWVKAAGESAPFLYTEVIHNAPRTQAETLVRTLAQGQAHPRYTGVIRILPSAQGSESYLNHHSLLLGLEAGSWTLPSLEILADQVKCSHAATVRTITEEDLFYLRSRGLGWEEAEKVLVKVFLKN